MDAKVTITASPDELRLVRKALEEMADSRRHVVAGISTYVGATGKEKQEARQVEAQARLLLEKL